MATRKAASHNSGELRLRPLRRAALPAATRALARFLIGKYVVHDVPQGRLCGRIVETEAYPPGDAAGHAYIGETRRNRALFLRRGHAYVYFAYGSSYLLNVSSESRGVGAGVLIRALEPRAGIAEMERRRGSKRLRDLARGPGRLAEALGVDLRQNGVDLCGDGTLRLASDGRKPGAIGRSVRIGITKDAHRLLRFYERGNPYVSGSRRLNH